MSMGRVGDGGAERAGGRRVCYFAHYDPDPIVADHVIHYLSAIREAGFAIVFGTPCPLGDAERTKVAALAEALVLRDNLGMDFGTWIDLLDRYPPGEDDLVLVCNDSVYAPLGDLGRFVSELLAHPADFYGAVASGEVTPHLQSWLLLFRPAAHRSAAFRSLLRPGWITPETSKTAIIDRYEMGLTAALAAQGLTFHAFYDWRRDSRTARALPFNPTHLLWDELVEAGMPFIKVELLRYNPASVPGVEDWRPLVERLAPELAPMVAADLARRSGRGKATPIVRPPSLSRLKGAPDPIYRRQLRSMIVRDFRATRRGQRVRGAANAAALHGAWHYTRLGRIVKWSVLDAAAALIRCVRRAT